MKEKTTQRIAEILVELKHAYPNMRFGQLVLSIAQQAKGPTVEAGYEVSDDEFLKAAQMMLRRWREEDEPVCKSRI